MITQAKLVDHLGPQTAPNSLKLQLHPIRRDASDSHSHQLGLHGGTGLRQWQLHDHAAHADLALDHGHIYVDLDGRIPSATWAPMGPKHFGK